MSGTPPNFRIVPPVQIMTAGSPSDSAAQEGKPAGALDFLYPIDQSGRNGEQEEDSSFFLWGDVSIEARHPYRIAINRSAPQV